MQLPYGAQAATYYPLNTELFYLWLMAPWHEDFLVNLGQFPFWIACGLAVTALARETGIGRHGAALGGAIALLIPGLIQQTTVARVDIAFSAWFLISLFFALRWGRERTATYLLLFGACMGLLVGTKSIGIVYSIIPATLFAFQLRDGWRAAAKCIASVAAVALVTGGFWYARNWLATGNPLFPLDVSVAGATLFHGAYGRDAMRMFHVTDYGELSQITGLFMGIWLSLYLFISASAAVLLALLKFRRGSGRLFLLAAPWMICAIFWFAIPHNNLTNGRFLFPAFLLMAYSVAMVIDECKGWATWIWGLVGLASVIGSGCTPGCDHLLLLLRDLAGCVAPSIGRLSDAGGNALLAPGAGAAAALMVGIALLFAARAVRKLPPLRYAAGIAAAIFLTLGARSAWDYHLAHKYDWYRAFPVGSAWAQLDEMTKGDSLRIASVGNERIYGLFGTGMRHDAFTVNVVGDPDEGFHDYWKKARSKGRGLSTSERPQYHREGGSAEQWIDNLRKMDVDFVFATTLEPMARVAMIHDQLGFPLEVEWADSRADIFRLKYANSQVRVYALKPAPEKPLP